MEVIRIIETRYNPPLLGTVALVSAQYLQATLTEGIWTMHTVCVPLWDGAIELADIRALPLGVLEALATAMPEEDDDEHTTQEEDEL